MTEYRLHGFAQSGPTYKAALMLALVGADWTPVFISWLTGGKTPEFLALNPMGEVPVLQHRELTLSQSGVILDYLAGRFGRYGPASEAERREVWRWMLWDNAKLTAMIGSYRFMTNFLAQAKRNEGAIGFTRGRAFAALKVLEDHLAGRDWVAAERPTIADVSCAGYLYLGDEFGMEPAEFPAIHRWLGRIRALPGWAHPYDLMPGHPLPGPA